MESNAELIRLHAALVSKIALNCALEGSSKTAVEIGNDIIAYGKIWLDAFANDGRIDDAETARLNDGFKSLADTRIRSFSFGWYSPVTLAYKLWLKPKIEKLLGIEF